MVGGFMCGGVEGLLVSGCIGGFVLFFMRGWVGVGVVCGYFFVLSYVGIAVKIMSFDSGVEFIFFYYMLVILF